jgi:C4-dicarboxylate transporter DctM subunit
MGAKVLPETEKGTAFNGDGIDSHPVTKIVNKAADFMGGVAGWGMLFVAIAMVYEIVMRYFGAPTTWVVEISGYSMIWFAFFSAAYGLHVGSHIQVDILILRLSPRTRNVLDIFNYTFVLVFTLMILYYSWINFAEGISTGERSSTMLRLHVGWLYGGVAVGCILMLMQALLFLVKSVMRAFQNRLEGGSHLFDNLALMIPLYMALMVGSAWLYVLHPMVGAMAIMLGGVPVFASLGMVGAFGLFFLLGADLGLAQISGISLKSLDNFTLLAIPLYILGGQILVSGGVGKELFNVCSKWIGHWPGGAMLATIGACAIFAAISGSSVATAATIGIVAIPEMLKRGYKPEHAFGVLGAGGTLGILIPPSAPMIIFSTLTEESTGALFMGGVIPGIIMACIFGIFAVTLCYKTGRYEKVAKASWSERLYSLKESFWGLMAPVIVIAGIYLGIVTPTEAAAVIVVYALAVGLVRGTIKIKDLTRIFMEGTRSSTMILMIIVGAMILGTVITFLQVPQNVCAYVGGLTMPPWVIMFILCVIYIILGCFLEVVSILMITVPIVYPLVIQLGYNGLWFGVFLVLLMEMALITPPVGLNLYVIQGIAKVGIEPVIKGVWPYMILLVLGLFMLYLWPDLILWLPGTMGFAGAK